MMSQNKTLKENYGKEKDVQIQQEHCGREKVVVLTKSVSLFS